MKNSSLDCYLPVPKKSVLLGGIEKYLPAPMDLMRKRVQLTHLRHRARNLKRITRPKQGH